MTNDIPKRRASDQRLEEFFTQFERHMKRTDDMFALQSDQLERLNDICHQNTESISTTAKSVQDLADATKGVVEVYNNASGAIKTAKALQDVIAWLVKLGFFGGLIAAFIIWLLEYFKGGHS